MDTEDGDFDGNVTRLGEREHEDVAASSDGDLRRDGMIQPCIHSPLPTPRCIFSSLVIIIIYDHIDCICY